MKWYAISGTWRKISQEVERDVKKTVEDIVLSGDGIVTGGALGVDYVATQTLLEIGNPKKQLKLYLPIPLIEFCKHYFKRAEQGIITKKQARDTVNQLLNVRKICPENIFDNWGFKKANKRSYYYRNTKIVENCDELYAFQVNESKGVQDAISKAKKIGKPIHLKEYFI